jgi:hypothetical protein
MQRVFETVSKKVFGSDEEFTLLQLSYEKYGGRFRKEKLRVLCEVFAVNCEEKLYEYNREEWEYKKAKKYLEKNSIDLFNAIAIVSFYFPKLPYLEAKNKGWVFRKYGEFIIGFYKLDEDHLITSYDQPCEYGYKEFFVFRQKLYSIFHCLNYDLADDNFPDVFENLTEIVKKDKLIVYLKLLKKRHGEPIYVDGFHKEESKIKLLDYLYPDVGGEKLFDFMKTNLSNEQYFFDENKKLDIDDFIRFLYLSKKFYKQIKKEV